MNGGKINIGEEAIKMWDKIPKLSFLLILCSFIITIIFLIIATYTTSIYDLWYAAAAYISIILIVVCYILFTFKCRFTMY